MSQNKTLFLFSRGLIVTAVAIFVAVTYNNCGQRGFQTEQAYIPNKKLQEDLKLSIQGKLNISVCSDSIQYECTRKIFSQDAENGKAEVDFPCTKMNDGKELCVSGLQFSYNTKEAAKNCQEGCNDNYEFEEFNCYYKLPNMNGSYPIQATAGSYDQALSETYSTCLAVVGNQ